MQVIRRAQTVGAFYGFDGDALFRLTDGSLWVQSHYKYWYHYAYRPTVEILSERGTNFLRPEGYLEQVQVEQIFGAIESRIAGVFEGWQGESEYELANGQVWRQRQYKYEYKYFYSPEAVVYSAPSGTVMDVEGSKSVVERVR